MTTRGLYGVTGHIELWRFDETIPLGDGCWDLTVAPKGDTILVVGLSRDVVAHLDVIWRGGVFLIELHDFETARELGGLVEVDE